MASSLLRELKDIQAMLAAPTAGSPSVTSAAAAGPLLRCAAASSDEEASVPPRHQQPAPASPSKHVRELERQVVALRQELAEAKDRCCALDEALQAARHDGSLAVARLQHQLAAKAEETCQLADHVILLRSEADGLRAQLADSAAATHVAETSTEQLQEVAAEWRRHGEEGLKVAAQERARLAALQAEVERLGVLLEAVQGERDELRWRYKASEAEVARLQADASGPALVAELCSRCAQERAWRKAVCRYLEGEMHAKAELERVLLNVGTSLRVGDTQARAAAAPPMPQRCMTAGQLSSMPAPPAVTVTVVHSPVRGPMLEASCEQGVSAGSCGEGRGGDPASWRQQFKETLAAFDERHFKLQKELSGLKSEEPPLGP